MQFIFDPILHIIALIAGLILVQLALSSHGVLRFVGNLIFFLLLSALLLMNGVEPYSTTQPSSDLWHRLFFGLAKAIWWLGGAMMLVSSVRLFLIFEHRPREARLAQDLLAGIIYVGAALSVVAYVFSVPVGTLIATSGVFAVILGLALQSTLSDVFSGIALNLGRPYSVGDWIILPDGVQGRVMETNWRATHLLNATNDLVVIPNSMLAKTQLVNFNGPDETHGVTIAIKLLPIRPPAAIEQLLGTVLLSSNRILRNPAPLVAIKGLDSHGIDVELSFRVHDAGQAAAATNEIYDLIYRHTQAADVPLSAADLTLMRPVWQTSASQPDPAKAPWRLLKAMTLFSTLTEEEFEILASSLVRRTYGKGTEIITQGIKAPCLNLIHNGVVVVERHEAGMTTELNRLSPGDFFGERGVLIGAEEPGTIRALTFVVAYEVSAAPLAEIMRNRPALAEELGMTLAHRLEDERHLAGLDGPQTEHPESLARRIRHLFQLQHHPVI
ncbi:mechanosensitive ion channel family protein (plasmid) [Rhizobium sp. T1470]|uniref:mechanosensitive ion channel domain-containing protein n=1 Tax=unclassified Rhizobium TaxID=2613769 RepID=UPI001AAF3BE4|nr:mechanosensitive ion channel family protein [Rhizobium sp. T1473]MCA0805584.1 mechanosensitive ion channel family protein [Rhizobium sp. T1473]